ncbi:PREDICTED: alpha-N-acetylneuraminide alpha-2,8-sialyltransferase-like [Branchiostoma belcheri]|uniref:Alpha-N-acetylneuraminide alpha-2,8-sialyltransferase-like n=1 Tax=Branchiostoma belcheri TaxID=7741 RepID=A0A6P4ZTF8_BRABE|nr:PREDICTED: alpha-N-acetylneuraminide alpha-2,8-sialyltransferase-like [Branchiostoma belcheri]
MLPVRLRRNECLLLSVYLVCVPLLVTQFWQDGARSYRTPRQQGGETVTLMTVENITSCVLPKYHSPKAVKTPKETIASPRAIFRNGSVFQTNSTVVETPKDLLNFFTTLESKSWRFNKKRTADFRRQLEEKTQTRQLMVLTRRNTPPKSRIKYAKAPNESFYISEQIWRNQPQDVPFDEEYHMRCSIVGNGGILKGSGCGKEIDKSDFVIRFNFPHVSRPYVKDIGIRTHMLACNAGIIDRNFRKMHSLSRNWLQKYQMIFRVGKFGKSTLLAFPFMVPGGHQSRVVKMQQVIRAQKISNKVVFNNPRHRHLMYDFWKSRGLQTRSLSSGFYVINAALSFCDEVVVYGFWPFDKDRAGRRLRYHVPAQATTVDAGMTNPWHRMDREFFKLAELYSQGIIKLVTKPCVKPPAKKKKKTKPKKS